MEPMKKLLFFFSVLACTSLVQAQEAFSAGIGVQVNNYSNDFVGIGGGAHADFRFNELLSVGTTFLYAADLGPSIKPPDLPLPALSVTELSVNVRWYFLRFKGLVDYYFMWQNFLHWFVQGDLGFAVLSAGGVSMTSNWSGIPFMLGITAGVRIMIANAYFEPYIRLGEPFMWGAGFLVGLRLTGKE